MLHLLGSPFPSYGLVLDGHPPVPFGLPCGLTQTVGSPPVLWRAEDDLVGTHVSPESTN